jgi:NADH dehydrogenase
MWYKGSSVNLQLAYCVKPNRVEYNRRMIPGSEYAFTFKTLADAILLRNHVIERFERADVETDPERKRRQLTFVIIGGGLVGVELFGELTAFADGVASLYKHVGRDGWRRP